MNAKDNQEKKWGHINRTQNRFSLTALQAQVRDRSRNQALNLRQGNTGEQGKLFR
jgi:hypothetical protein